MPFLLTQTITHKCISIKEARNNVKEEGGACKEDCRKGRKKEGDTQAQGSQGEKWSEGTNSSKSHVKGSPERATTYPSKNFEGGIERMAGVEHIIRRRFSGVS